MNHRKCTLFTIRPLCKSWRHWCFTNKTEKWKLFCFWSKWKVWRHKSIPFSKELLSIMHFPAKSKINPISHIESWEKKVAYKGNNSSLFCYNMPGGGERSDKCKRKWAPAAIHSGKKMELNFKMLQIIKSRLNPKQLSRTEK